MIHDNTADAVYIYFSKYPESESDKTYLCNPKEINGMINLDFANNKFVGIEVMDASRKLPEIYLKSKKAAFKYNKLTNICLIDFDNVSEVSKIHKCDTSDYGGIIKLCFNKDNRLFRIEINNASVLLRNELLFDRFEAIKKFFQIK